MVVADGETDGVYYYHNDHIGTPQRLTDATGTVAWAADYLPFGGVDITVEAVENNLRFAGQYYDNETGLHYNYHRYYDPVTGRYLTADPIGLAEEDVYSESSVPVLLDVLERQRSIVDSLITAEVVEIITGLDVGYDLDFVRSYTPSDEPKRKKMILKWRSSASG